MRDAALRKRIVKKRVYNLLSLVVSVKYIRTHADDSERVSSHRGTSASSSSTKMRHGEDARARAKTWGTARSLSPTYCTECDRPPPPGRAPACGSAARQPYVA